MDKKQHEEAGEVAERQLSLYDTEERKIAKAIATHCQLGKEHSKSPDKDQFKLKEPSTTKRDKQMHRDRSQKLLPEQFQAQYANPESADEAASPSPSRKPPTIAQRMLQKE